MNSHNLYIHNNIFFGESEFKLNIQPKPINYLIHYIQTCIKDMFGFFILNSKNIKFIIPHLIMQAFHSCLSYNKISLPETKFIYCKQPVFLAEPVYFKQRGDVLIFYISEGLINAMINTNTFCSINYNENDFMYNDTEDEISRQAIPTTILQQLIKLLIIAEHAALHYYNIIANQTTDWVMHKNYISHNDSKTEFISVHTLININCVTTSILGNTQNKFTFNTSTPFTEDLDLNVHIPLNF